MRRIHRTLGQVAVAVAEDRTGRVVLVPFTFKTFKACSGAPRGGDIIGEREAI
jgi:hypothetical protein